MTAADVLVETLIDWDVDTIFGLPGDGINGLMESLRAHQDQIRFIQVRQEESAAFVACAYAKFTGRLGVCLATSGPGGVHILNGLYDAKMDGEPVLAITGLQFHDLIGTFTQQDVGLDRLYMDVAAFNERIMGAAHVENVTDLAVRTALSYRTVSHLTFPVDFQEMEVKSRQRSKRNIPHHTSHAEAGGAMLANTEDLERAALILNDGNKIAILAGRGALRATAELEQLADFRHRVPDNQLHRLRSLRPSFFLHQGVGSPAFPCFLPQVEYLFDRVTLAEVDRDSTELSGLCQPLGNAIDYVDLRGAPEQRTILREQPYGARSEHRDILPRTDSGQFRGMESRREDIGQE